MAPRERTKSVRFVVARSGIKSALYRVFATCVTAVVTMFAFDSPPIGSIARFAAMDLVAGTATYFLFEVAWNLSWRGIVFR